MGSTIFHKTKDLSIKKLPKSFYLHSKVTKIAENLLGKVLCHFVNGEVRKGVIVETEAYSGRNDRACHADQGRRSQRTQVMYEEGGCSYIYLCYGIHHLFNVVCNRQGLADAVLIRALQVIEDQVQEPIMSKQLLRSCAGPGKLSHMMGFHTNQSRTSLLGEEQWVEDWGFDQTLFSISSGPRIGVDYAGEDALLPWRFWINGHPSISK